MNLGMVQVSEDLLISLYPNVPTPVIRISMVKGWGSMSKVSRASL